MANLPSFFISTNLSAVMINIMHEYFIVCNDRADQWANDASEWLSSLGVRAADLKVADAHYHRDCCISRTCTEIPISQ